MSSAPLAHSPYQQDAILCGGRSSPVRNERGLRETHRKGSQSFHRPTTLLHQMQGTTRQNCSWGSQKKQAQIPRTTENIRLTNVGFHSNQKSRLHQVTARGIINQWRSQRQISRSSRTLNQITYFQKLLITIL